MKAILEFDLPEYDCQFKIASTAMDWALAVHDIANELRRHEKYVKHTEKELCLIEELRDFLYDILNNRGINLDMIE